MPEAEGRLVDYVDNRIGRLEDKLDQRLDKQDDMLREIARDVSTHVQAPGHQTGLNMHQHLEQRVEALEKRPLARWQVVSAAVGMVLMLCSLAMGAVSLLFGVIAPFVSQHLH